MDRDTFVRTFAEVFESSPWVAEAAFDRGLPRDAATPEGLHRALCAALRAAPDERKLALVRAHPDLAGRLARAGGLTAASTREQGSAGLDGLDDAEAARFLALNTAYTERFGFPFVVAVRGLDKAAILERFEARLGHGREEELRTALREIERIARFRLDELVRA